MKSLLNAPFRFVGFACDMGVLRNSGRLGAKNGPEVASSFLRKRNMVLNDIVKYERDLTYSQHNLAQKVYKNITKTNTRSFVIGGGHETSYGHFLGFSNALPKSTKIGIVNLDAHLDLRPMPEDGIGTSGTPFTQIRSLCEEQGRDFDYTCIGVQRGSTSEELYQRAKDFGTTLLHHDELDRAPKVLHKVLERNDVIYLSVCLDAFNAGIAPGVSAPQPFGFLPQEVLPLIRILRDSNKLFATDIVEYNPKYDDKNQITARLLTDLASEIVVQNK